MSLPQNVSSWEGLVEFVNSSLVNQGLDLGLLGDSEFLALSRLRYHTGVSSVLPSQIIQIIQEDKILSPQAREIIMDWLIKLPEFSYLKEIPSQRLL